MKQIVLLSVFSAVLSAYAQPRLLNQAMITTKTTIVAPEGDEPVQTTQTADGGEMRVVRFGGEGETKSTTYLKNDLTKTFSESDMGQTTVIRDNAKKITTTIMEIMGRKNGFYATDEDQELMRKRMDSMMATRNQSGGFNMNSNPPTWSFVYLPDSKKIAGFECKKALMIAQRPGGTTDTTTVWYTPDIKFQNLPSTGGMGAGIGGIAQAPGADGLAALNGFPMEYERTLRGGRKMSVQVTKLVIDKDIADKEFEIPKDVDVKPMKDMQNGGPNIQIRIGG
jgi:GLPGLI family protein